MTGMFSVRGLPITVLFDTGASHSFIGAGSAASLGSQLESIRQSYSIATPRGRINTSLIAKRVPLKMGDIVFDTDLINLGDQDLDVILGMDWMG